MSSVFYLMHLTLESLVIVRDMEINNNFRHGSVRFFVEGNFCDVRRKKERRRASNQGCSIFVGNSAKVMQRLWHSELNACSVYWRFWSLLYKYAPPPSPPHTHTHSLSKKKAIAFILIIIWLFQEKFLNQNS